MPLYLVEHTHRKPVLPRTLTVRQLSAHMTAANAGKHGVKLVADFVDGREPGVVLVLEADSPDKATNFALPFLHAGSITVRSGGTCAEVARQCLGG